MCSCLPVCSDEAVTTLVESAHDQLGELIDCVSVDDVTRQRVLGLWAWITKALVLRGHPAQIQWVSKVGANKQRSKISSIS